MQSGCTADNESSTPPLVRGVKRRKGEWMQNDSESYVYLSNPLGRDLTLRQMPDKIQMPLNDIHLSSFFLLKEDSWRNTEW